MVVKQKRGRRRYVIFACDPPYSDRNEAVAELNHLFRVHDGRPPHVIDTGEWHLIVRCSPSEVGDIISTLSEGDRSIRSLRTSGTLRTLRERYRLTK